MRRMVYSLVFWLAFYVASLLWILFFNGSVSWSAASMFLFAYSVSFFECVSLNSFKLFREPIRAVSLL